MTDSGFIYFIQVGSDGPVKVGWTNNVKRRLSHLQIGHPEKLFVRVKVEAPRTFEGCIHEFLADYRIRGEWFEPQVADHEFLARLTRASQQRRYRARKREAAAA